MEVIDTTSNIDVLNSVGVKRNTIVDISEVDEKTIVAESVIDVEGCYMFPELANFHVKEGPFMGTSKGADFPFSMRKDASA